MTAPHWSPQHKDAFRALNGRRADPPAAIWVQATENLVFGGEITVDGEIIGGFGTLKSPSRLVHVGMTSDPPWLNRVETQADRGHHRTVRWVRLWLPDATHARRHVPTCFSALSDAAEVFVGNGWLALNGCTTPDNVVALLKGHLRHAWGRHDRLPPQWVETDDEIWDTCDRAVSQQARQVANVRG
jgi:hypothetical protein